MTHNKQLEQVVKYFKETFNDDIYYCLDTDGEILVSSKPGVTKSLTSPDKMFTYDEHKQTLTGLFNKKMKYSNPNIDLNDKRMTAYVSLINDNFISQYNYPVRLYSALIKTFGPTKKVIDDNIYSIKLKINELEGVTTISHEVVFSMYLKTEGRINFVIKFDGDLNLTDIILHDKGELFNLYALPLNLAEKQTLFTVVLGSLINKDFAEYFNKDNVDYSDRAFELLTILEF